MSGIRVERYRRRSILLILLGSALVMAGCSGGSSPEADDTAADPAGSTDGETDGGSPADGSPINVGFVMPLAGNLAFLGESMLAGFECALGATNDEGGIEGRPIEVISRNNDGDPGTTISAIRSVAEDEVVAFYATPISSNLEAAIPTFQELEVPVFSPGTATATIAPPQPYVYGSDIPPPAEAPVQLGFAAELLGDGEHTLFLAPSDTPASVEWIGNVERLTEEDHPNLTVAGDVLLAIAAADVTAEAQQIVGARPDAVLTQLTEGPLRLLSQTLRDQGFDGPIINYHGGGAPATLQQLGDPNVYVARSGATIHDDPSGGAGLAQYIEATAACGHDDTADQLILYTNGYVAGLVFSAVLEECGGDCDGVRFNEIVGDITVDTEGVAFAPITYSADDHQGLDTDIFYHFDGSSVVRAADGATFEGKLPLFE